jgi:hypothetical protein
MIPGPTLIIPCPRCGETGKKSTLISGNTFGQQLWSDGKRIARMLPDYPWLVKCRHCGKFFYTQEERAIASVEWDDESNSEYEKVP